MVYFWYGIAETYILEEDAMKYTVLVVEDEFEQRRAIRALKLLEKRKTE